MSRSATSASEKSLQREPNSGRRPSNLQRRTNLCVDGRQLPAWMAADARDSPSLAGSAPSLDEARPTNATNTANGRADTDPGRGDRQQREPRLALIAAIVAVPFLMLAASRGGDAANIVGASVFATAMVLLYGASMMYHALPHPRAKAIFRRLDHGAIYLLIAGTYTPFTLGALAGPWGWTLFGVIWGLAAVGIVLKAFDRIEHPVLSTGLYLAMGWLVLIALRAADRAGRRTRSCLARGRRDRLHGGCRVLRAGLALAVRAFRLASVRHCRYDLPLLRSARVLSLSGAPDVCRAAPFAAPCAAHSNERPYTRKHGNRSTSTLASLAAPDQTSSTTSPP